MFTVDARCDRCANKDACKERKPAITGLMNLANQLNAPEFDDSPGDGMFQFYCHNFTIG